VIAREFLFFTYLTGGSSICHGPKTVIYPEEQSASALGPIPLNPALVVAAGCGEVVEALAQANPKRRL
jgi:hypothetical protein